MTRFEKLITEKREELKKILIKYQCPRCPSEFGIENPKYCDITNALTWDCETCWNEETEKEKAVAGNPVFGEVISNE
jgi:hypothetical protein